MRTVFVLAALFLATTAAQAQTPAKVIGTLATAARAIDDRDQRPERQARHQKLVLDGVSPAPSCSPTGRSGRRGAHRAPAPGVEIWRTGSFAKDPPNATVSAMNKAKGTVSDAVVVLKAPKLEGERLTFDVSVLEGDLGQADGPATLFIDIIDLPVARRTAQRSAWYAGAK